MLHARIGRNVEWSYSAVKWESNGGRIAVESQSNRSCDHRLANLFSGNYSRL